MDRVSRIGSAVVVGLAVMVVAAGSVSQAFEETTIVAGELDGKVFVGELGGKGKAQGDRDVFSFETGQFRSSACAPYGFGAAPYTIEAAGDTVTFSAHTFSPTDGTMMWEGTVHGEVLEGTAWWQRQAEGAPEEFWFKGSLKQ